MGSIQSDFRATINFIGEPYLYKQTNFEKNIENMKHIKPRGFNWNSKQLFE